MIKRVPWFRRRRKTAPELPLRLPIEGGALPSGRSAWPDSPRRRLIRKLVLEKAEEIARRERVDRREFLASACGMATTLYMINLVNGCASHRVRDGRSASGSGGGGTSAAADAGRGGAEGGRAGASGSGGGSGGAGRGAQAGVGGGGGFAGMTPEMMQDAGMAEACLGSRDELIIDMQTLVLTEQPDMSGVIDRPPTFGWSNPTNFPWLEYRQDPGTDNLNRSAYEELILNGSDTTVGVLSGVSYTLGPDGMNGTGVITNEQLLSGAEYLSTQYPRRVLSQCTVMPNDRLALQLATMERFATSFTHWKTYPPWGPREGTLPEGYWLDGMDDPDQVGPKMIQHGLDLGVSIFSVYKGSPLTGFSPLYSGPRDIGPAAKMFPRAHFVVCQAAFEYGMALGSSSRPTERPTADLYCTSQVQRPHGMWPEGPYDESDEAVQLMYPLDRGVNSLIKSLRDSGIGPNGTRLDLETKAIIPGTADTTHVYVELGYVWPSLMTQRVEEAMHVIGKLLAHIGEDRILWGTFCLAFASPQPLIESFRCFEISQEFQERYGYPALTEARKQKIFGQNAALLNLTARGIEGYYGKCHRDIVGAQAVQRKRELDEEFGPRRDMLAAARTPTTRRELLRLRPHAASNKRTPSGRT